MQDSVKSSYVTKMSFRPQTSVKSLSFSSDGQFLACAGPESSIKIWELGIGRRWISGSTIPGERGSVIHSIQFNPKAVTGQGYEFVTAGTSGVQLWKHAGDTFHVERTFNATDATAMLQAIYSADGRFIVAASQGHGVFIWDRVTGDTQRHLPSSVQCVTASRDGRWIAAGSGSEALIWNMRDIQPCANARGGHWADISSLCFSPDGKRLFTAAKDFTVKIWDTSDLESQPERAKDVEIQSDRLVPELLTLLEHRGFLTSVSFSPDERNPFVLTTGLDGQAIVWPSRSESGDALNKSVPSSSDPLLN
jgi:WD40 repeat protein